VTFVSDNSNVTGGIYGFHMKSDFDVTDSYVLDWLDDLSATLTLKGGLRIEVELEPRPEWAVAYRVTSIERKGTLAHELSDIAENDSVARSCVNYWVRLIINAEEPLGEIVNWSNSELVYLLEEQQRINLCPLCIGITDPHCHACGGTCYIRSEAFSSYIDIYDDSEPTNESDESGGHDH